MLRRAVTAGGVKPTLKCERPTHATAMLVCRSSVRSVSHFGTCEEAGKGSVLPRF